MQVLPTSVHNFRSNAERKVFEALRATDLGPHAFALHSLNLSRHDYKRWAEEKRDMQRRRADSEFYDRLLQRLHF